MYSSAKSDATDCIGRVILRATWVMPEKEPVRNMAIHEEMSDAERALLGIVRELLKNDDIGLDDDFFLAGGHSLLGTQLVIRARKAFGVKIALRDLFETGTVRKLAARVEELVMEELDSMSEEDIARLSSAE